jgi:hypothetical protein
MLCNLFGSAEKTYGKPQPELSMFRPIFEWSFIACAGTFNVFITRYVCLPRVKSPVCQRSGVQLNVAKALCNINFFLSVQANDEMTFANWALSPSPQFV